MSNDPLHPQAIFAEAVERVPPERWPGYLDEACGADQALRAQVQRLLDAHRDIGSFMAKPAAEPVATLDLPPLAEGPGTMIGRYKLLEEIGAGGMGVVYMAEQREPVRRKVALKIIKPGMDTRQVVARFEAERQALAMMDHQNIAHVLDGGATESGRPYFVMELVQGIPITEFCDRNDFATRQRLELFVAVCQAVQHAHHKGIIHRDIKPSNVMVTLLDGVPIPKIIDFGVAKAVNQPLTDKTVFTGYGQMLGTPLYMSPEQAQMSAVDVDTRSDIYSLGVLLYELLTGSTPFDAQRLREAGLDEVCRIIREEEPVRPSQRITTLDGEALVTVTQHRGTDVRRLGQLLRGDLDWIVMRALEKDRNRRYESASALAADVQRYLADEPVKARPPTIAHRTAKWARRHRAAAWSAAVSVAACGVILVASAFLVLAAYQREKEQRKTADANAAKAEQSYEKARQAVGRMLTQFANNKLGAYPELAPIRKHVLDDAIQLYNELIEINPNDAQVYSDRADTWGMLAEYGKQRADYQKAIDLEPRNAAWHCNMAHHLCAPWDPRYRDREQALKHARRAVELAPTDSKAYEALGYVHRHAGRPQEAIAAFQAAKGLSKGGYGTALAEAYMSAGDNERAFDILSKEIVRFPNGNPRTYERLSEILSWRGEHDKALEASNKAVELVSSPNAKRQLGPNSLTACEFFEQRGRVYMALNDFTSALKDFDKAVELAPFVLSVRNSRVRCYLANGKPEKALDDWNEFIRIAPHAESYAARGEFYLDGHDFEKAAADFDRAVELGTISWHYYKRRAAAHFQLKHYDKALESIAKAVELEPSDTSNLTWLAPAAVAKCPDERLRTGLLELADKTIRWPEATPPDRPKSRHGYATAAGAYVARARLYAAFGQPDKAEADLTKAIELEPKNGDVRGGRAVLYAEQDKWEPAIAEFSKAVELKSEATILWYQRALTRLAAGRPDDYRKDCGEMLQRFAQTDKADDAQWVAWTCALGPDATADWPKAIALAEKASQSDPMSFQCLNTLGAVLYRAGRFEDAAKKLKEAESLGQGSGGGIRSAPAYTWFFLAMVQQRLQHPEDARAAFDKAVAETDKVLPEHKEGIADLPWNRRLTLKLLRDEAQAVLGIPEAPTTKKEKTE